MTAGEEGGGGEEGTYAKCRPSKIKRPLQIYENFRSVYRGVRKVKDESHIHHQHPAQTATATTAAGASKTDGNSTDDSGIDSICVTSPSSSSRQSPARNLGIGPKIQFKDRVTTTNKVKETIAALERKCGGESKKSAADLAQLNKLLNDTEEILSRNSKLRASFTISMKKPLSVAGSSSNKKKIASKTIAIATPKSVRRNNNNQLSHVKSTGKKSSSGEKVRKIASSSSEDDEDKSLQPTTFVRHNPIQQRNKSATSSANSNNKTVIRRSIRLAPKTVANLASKFEHDRGDFNARKDGGKNAGAPVRGKAKISEIVGALNKLDEEAAKDTAVLRRSLRRAALQAARENKGKDKQEIAEHRVKEEEDDDEDVDVDVDEDEDCFYEKIGGGNEDDGSKLQTTARKKKKLNENKREHSNSSEARTNLTNKRENEEDKHEEEDFIVTTAKPAIVVLDEQDDTSMIENGLKRKAKNGGMSLYESIAGSLLNLIGDKSGENVDELYSTISNRDKKVKDPLQFTLAKLSDGFLNRNSSTTSSSTSSSSGCFLRSSSSEQNNDDWVDIDEESEEEDDVEKSKKAAIIERNVSFAR